MAVGRTAMTWVVPVALALASAAQTSTSGASPNSVVARRPSLFAVVIGIGDYPALKTGRCDAFSAAGNPGAADQDELTDPSFARRDAEAIAARFRGERRGPIFERVEVTLLTDAGATRSAVDAALQKLQTARSEDVVVIFFSGHAVTEPSTGAGHLLLADSDVRNLRTAMRTSDLLAFAQTKTPAKRIAVLLDNCYSAAVGMVKDAPADVVRFWRRHYELIPGLSTLASSESSQPSFSDSGCQMSLFTGSVLEGLGRKGATLTADGDGDGIVTLRELWQYVRPRVSTQSGDRQRPDLLGTGDVPIAALRPLPAAPSFLRLHLESEPTARLFVGDGSVFDYVGDSPVFPRATSGHGQILALADGYATETRAVEAAFLKAYRWQYIHSGAQHPQFGKVLSSLITEHQGQRIQAALATLQ